MRRNLNFDGNGSDYVWDPITNNILCYEQSAAEIHARWGGKQYYFSRSGLSGAGFIASEIPVIMDSVRLHCDQFSDLENKWTTRVAHIGHQGQDRNILVSARQYGAKSYHLVFTQGVFTQRTMDEHLRLLDGQPEVDKEIKVSFLVVQYDAEIDKHEVVPETVTIAVTGHAIGRGTDYGRLVGAYNTAARPGWDGEYTGLNISNIYPDLVETSQVVLGNKIIATGEPVRYLTRDGVLLDEIESVLVEEDRLRYVAVSGVSYYPDCVILSKEPLVLVTPTPKKVSSYDPLIGSLTLSVILDGQDYHKEVLRENIPIVEEFLAEAREHIHRKNAADARAKLTDEERTTLTREWLSSHPEQVLTIEDSTRVGNCEVGTKNWIGMYGLKETVTCKEILDNAWVKEILEHHAFQRVVLALMERL